MTEQERWREVKRRRRATNPEALREINRRWYANNADGARAMSRKSRAKARVIDPVRENARSVKWQAANKDKRNALHARRRAEKLQRTPAWVDHENINEQYTIAAAATELFDEPFHVDHIIPLKGKLVSGLHVHTNLQVLRGSENCKKYNRFQVEFQNETRDPATAA